MVQDSHNSFYEKNFSAAFILSTIEKTMTWSPAFSVSSPVGINDSVSLNIAPIRTPSGMSKSLSGRSETNEFFGI
jgi:hypothetical protein